MAEVPKDVPSNEGQIEIRESSPPRPTVDVDLETDDTKKRKLTSVVWQHFKKKKINGQEKALCNYCQKELGGSSRNGTKHLHEHFKICPQRKTRDIRQAILNPSKKKDGGTMLGTYSFDQENSRHQLARMIILHEYPLNMVEHEGFRSFVSSIQPLFNHVTRNTIKKDIFKIYDGEKKKTMDYLNVNSGRIAITTDMWTSNNQKRGYMVVTAHYIDDSWTLHNRILRFIYVPSPHTAEALSKVLMQCLVAWNIDRKLSTLTLDNCSTNDAMVESMLEKLSSHLMLGGKLVHMRCCAHILNLIVKEGLDAIEDGIENIRDSVVYWTATPKRAEKFEEAARQIKIPCTRKLVLDCRTRWNSTYLMIASALIYKDVFSRLTISEKKYKHLPSEREWLLAAVMCDKLKLFHSVTELFSGSQYPTANLFFPKMCQIKLLLNECLESEYVEIMSMAQKMIEKFKKYWNTIHGILAIATILDPRFKMKLIEFYFPRIYGNGSAIEIERVRNLCLDLVAEYNLKQDKGSSVDHSLGYSQRDSIIIEGSVDDLEDYDLFVTSTANVENFKSEIECYLEEGVLPRTSDFDILAWWKNNGLKYPILQSIAKDVLAIPITTVASESAFSTSGRHVTPHRNRLHPNTLEALVCAQDWLWIENSDSSTSTHKYSRMDENMKDDGEGLSYVDFDV